MTSNFQKLKYKIFDLPPEDDVLDHFPELKRYTPLTRSKAPLKNQLLRYMIFMYDPGTDLNREFPELERRKVRAAELAGFKAQDDHLTSIFNLTDKTALEFIMCFFTQVYHNRTYTEWHTLYQELDETTRLRLEPIATKKAKQGADKAPEDVDVYAAADKKSKLREHAAEIHKLIDAIEEKMFGDNKDVEEVMIKARFLSPETFAGIEQ